MRLTMARPSPSPSAAPFKAHEFLEDALLIFLRDAWAVVATAISA